MHYKVPPGDAGLPLDAYQRNAKPKKQAPPANAKKLSYTVNKGKNLNGGNAPYLTGRGIELKVPFSYDGTDGVLIAQGGASNGYALWLKAGVPQWSVAHNDALATVAAKTKLAKGSATLHVHQTPKGQVTIKLDGKEIAKGKVEGPFPSQPFDGLTVGQDGGSELQSYGNNKPYQAALGPIQLKLIK